MASLFSFFFCFSAFFVLFAVCLISPHFARQITKKQWEERWSASSSPDGACTSAYAHMFVLSFSFALGTLHGSPRLKLTRQTGDVQININGIFCGSSRRLSPHRLSIIFYGVGLHNHAGVHIR